MALLAVFGSASARAEVTHKPLFQIEAVPAKGPHGESVAIPGPLQRMEAMTVDSSRLWVAEDESGNWSRLDEFNAETGAFIAQPASVEAAAQPGSGYGEDYGVGLAIGHGTGEALVYLAGMSSGVPTVSLLDEAGHSKATWTGSATPGKSFEQIAGIAADNSIDPLDSGRGNVLVASHQQIDVFHPETTGDEHYVGQIAGVSPSEPFQFIAAVAVDELSGDLYVLDRRGAGGVVDVFEPNGLGGYTFVRKIEGPSGRPFSSPFTMAVDARNGEVYITEFAPEGYYLTESYLIDEFSATGAYLGRVEDIPDPYAIAVDPASHDLYAREQVYGPDVVLPDVRTASVGQTPQSVTLNGTVDPDGAGEASCQFDWGNTPALGKIAPCSQAVPNGEGAVAVHALISSFERDTTYYYRLQASNANGTNYGEPAESRQFTTTGAAIHAAFATNISATSATLDATIDPGGTPTSYYFQYGPTAAYGAEVPTAPGASLGAGRGVIEAPALHVQQLTPGSVYHYRAVALSEAQPGQIETLYSEDHTFTTQAAGGSFTLADGRQWQLVSPADKLGALIEPHQFGGVIQAAADGNAIAYHASSPTEHAAQGFAREVAVLSTRGASGWSSQDISEPNLKSVYTRGSIGKEFQIFSEDLSHAAIQPIESAFTPLSPEASETTPYLRTDYLNGNVEEHCQSGCYRPLVTGKTGFANVPAGTVFGEEPQGFCELDLCGPKFQGANADLSHMVISSPVQLTETPAPAGGPGLYEWSDGSLQLLDLLPSGEEGPAVLAGVSHDTAGHYQLGVRNSISADGTRVILEGGAEGGHGLYLRDTAAGQTIRLDVPQGGSGTSEDVSYVDANPDASRIFFLDSGQLMADSSPGGEDLYEYDLQAPAGSRLSDLSAASSPGQSADVSALLGIGGDGAYVYFAAGGALAPGAVAGQCPQESYTVQPQSPGCNLYVRHDGATRLVAVLPSEDTYTWSRGLADLGQASYVRVSASGQWLTFLSNGELTGYDSHDAVSGQSDIEVYVYDASTGEVACASCDPTGARPEGAKFEEFGTNLNAWVAARLPAWTEPPTNFGSLAAHQPRYLSDSGRLFFDSTAALVPQDVDGVEDVYEWEPVGVGSCTTASATFSVGSQSCVNLVSSGTSPEPSELIDASETGGDVFFRTRAQLALQDYDTAYDIYDAHECASAVPCLPVMTPTPTCSTETSCKAPPTPQPALFGAPASATFSGAGNLASQAVPTAKPKSTKPKSKPKAKSKPRAKSKRRSVKCGKPSTKRKCTRSPRAARHSRHENAGTDRHAPGAHR